MSRKNNHRKLTKNYAFVVDGKSEVWYLNMLKRHESDLRVKIKPEIPNQKSVSEQFDLAVKLSRNYSKVFWIIDLDKVLEDSKSFSKGGASPIQSFIEYRNKIEKDISNIMVIVNNPCIELWFYLHFKKSTRYFNNCGEVEKLLKKELPAYEKTQKYYTKQDEDIYSKLRARLVKAINNSSTMGSFSIQGPERTLSEMEKLFGREGLNIIR